MYTISKEALATALVDPDPQLRKQLADLLLGNPSVTVIGGDALSKLTGEDTPQTAVVFPERKYVVWNADKSIGFITTEWQLAYESRKGADSNCYSEKLDSMSGTAVGFCDDTGDENCTMEELVSFTTQPAKKPTE